jgi:hypothetical protein
MKKKIKKHKVNKKQAVSKHYSDALVNPLINDLEEVDSDEGIDESRKKKNKKN